MDQEKYEDEYGTFDDEAKELNNEIEENRYSPRRPRRETNMPAQNIRKFSLLLIGAILVFFLIIQWISTSKITGQYEALTARFVALEERIVKLEAKVERPSEIVAKIDKLDSLVAELGTSVRALAKRMDDLSQAMKLTKSKPAKKSPFQTSRTHIVKKGDNLYRIAKKYGVSLSDLCRANGLSTKSLLHQGQKLIIPNK